MSPETATLAPIADPVDVAAMTRPRTSLQETVNQTLTMAWRSLRKMRRNPEQFFDVIIQPLLFTAMFTYIFGGAISGSVANYMPIIIPGILAQTALTACMAMGTQLRDDMDKGVFDRFKSLPIARIAPLAGPALADVIRYVIAATLTILVGLAMGYRPGGGFLGTLGGWTLTIVAAWSLAWIFTWLGTIARSAQAVQGISMMIMFPLSFMSNAFVKEDTMPDWLQAFVKVNPVSHVVTAVRDLMNEGRLTADVGWALLGCAIVVAIFAPLSVRSYRRHL
ncbi:MAG TPA: ABC transporter permease [Marmoricola sp.]|nr:ABC transporter permease [Marmoricola sp.]